MYSMNFVIPLHKDELLDNNSSDQYCVKDVVPLSSLSSLLTDCRDALQLDGVEFILQHFDTLFSFLIHFKELDWSLINKDWILLKNAFSQLVSSLSVLLEDSNAVGENEPTNNRNDKGVGTLDSETRMRTLNTLRMLTYVYCQTFMHCEDRLAKKNLMAPLEAKKGRKKGRAAIDLEDDQEDCDDKRQEVLSHFYSLLQLPINRLWEPPVAEEEFINLISNCCYKILEDPTIANVRLRHIRESIFQVLGTLIKRHNHGLSCSLKIVQLLKIYEHTSTPLAQGLASFAGSDLGCKSMVREVLREISETDPGEFTADASGTRAICHFLTELAVGLPTLVQSSISLILPQLDYDSYSMRICVLGVLTEIISQLLSGEDLDESAKNTRDMFLDHLESHMHDVNAFVRSKVLQYWQRLCCEKAVPLSRQHDVLEKTVGRLSDKSNLVRKYALQLVRSFLEGNPFTAKLGLKDLLAQLEVEKQNLSDLEKKYGLTEKDKEEESADIPKKPVTDDPLKKAEWKKIESNILEYVFNYIEDDSKDPIEEEIITSAMKLSLKELYNNIIKNILDEKYNVSVQLLITARKKHPDGNKIKLSEDGDDDIDLSDEEKQESEKVLSEEEESPVREKKRMKKLKKRMRYFGKLLRKIYMENSGETEPEVSAEKSVNPELQQEGSKDADSSCNLDAAAMEKIQMQSALVQFLEDSVVFSRLVSEVALPRICQLLSSNHSTDILEAIDFFTSASKFGLSEANIGTREMLPLVFAKETNVKNAVVEAYRKLYLIPVEEESKDIDANTENDFQDQEVEQPVRRNPRKRAVQVIRNLSGLIIGANMGARDSLEELVREWVASGDLDSHCIKVMWERFSGAIPGTTSDESRAAAVLLGMVAGAEVQTIWTNLSVIVKVGLRGEKAQTENEESGEIKFDSLMVTEACEALLRMVKTHKKQQNSLDPPLRLPYDDVIFTTLAEILLKGLWNFQDNYYLPMAGLAIDVMYQMAEKPDLLCGKLIKDICIGIRDRYLGEKTGYMAEDDIFSKEPKPLTQSTEGGTEPPKEIMGPPAPPQPSKYINLPVDVLSRFLFIVGHVAFRQFVYLDTQVFTELKRRNNVREKIQEKQQDGKKGNKARKNSAKSANCSSKTLANSSSKTLSVSASEKSRLEVSKTDDGEDDVIGAVADDAEAEFIRRICEVELVTGNNLLALLCPIVVMVCSKPKKYHNSNLRESAVLALAKYMCVSSSLCQKYMQLFITVMERSPEPTIRANCIIALGDLCYRFPNITEPWSPNLYKRLRDESDKVRQNTLMVLTHLIMNDMVKVKGQISDMALCILDPNQKLSEIAKLFFQELAQKGNALYNVMTDIISRLSNPSLGVPEKSFQTILSFLMQLIQKDRQVDSLVEKLCLRFQTTSSGALIEKVPKEVAKEEAASKPEEKENVDEENEKDKEKEKEINNEKEEEVGKEKDKETNEEPKPSNEVGKDARDEDEKRQWRDLAFCLSLLPYNSERAIRRLMSHMPCYADKIAKEPQVYTYFMNIVATAKKAAKTEIKVVVDELEQKIEECIETADEEGNVHIALKNPTQTPVKKGTAAQPKSAARSARQRRKPVASSSGSDFESPDESKGKKLRSVTKSVQRRKGRPQKQSVSSDDEVPPATRTRNPRRRVTYEENTSEKENAAEEEIIESPEPKRKKRERSKIGNKV